MAKQCFVSNGSEEPTSRYNLAYFRVADNSTGIGRLLAPRVICFGNFPQGVGESARPSIRDSNFSE